MKQNVISNMKKYKLESEYDKVLLRRSGNSKRRRDEKDDLILVPVPPPFSLVPENKWVEFKYEDGQMEVWKKICVEAYCIGWLDFYDNQNSVLNREIFFLWEDFQSEKSDGKDDPSEGGSTVTVYIDPGPQTLAVPLSDPPKPPPPPMS